MNVKVQYWKYSLVTIIVVLGTILFVEFIPFLGGILGACTIYILVRKQMLYLTEKKQVSSLSTEFFIIESSSRS